MNDVVFSSNKDDWETPQDLFDELDRVYHFTLDAAANEKNHKCRNYYTIEDDGLSKNWGGQSVYVNPPYGRKIREWVEHAYLESRKPGTTVVMLLPCRTDRDWFHDYCLPFGEITFIRGRLRFKGATNNAPFPSMIVVFGNS